MTSFLNSHMLDYVIPAFIIFLISLILIKLYSLSKKERLPYVRRPLLTQNELSFYKKLKPVAEMYDLHILAKIRMADIVGIQTGLSREERAKYFNKIKSKHVDFALVEPDTLEIVALIELDDSSHKQKDRIERDSFVDSAYTTAGITVIHTYGKDMDRFIEVLDSILQTSEC